MASNKNSVQINLDKLVGKNAEEKETVTDEVVETVIDEELVPIRTNATFRQYVGNKWYFFEKGKEVYVTPLIKEMLKERKALEVF